MVLCLAVVIWEICRLTLLLRLARCRVAEIHKISFCFVSSNPHEMDTSQFPLQTVGNIIELVHSFCHEISFPYRLYFFRTQGCVVCGKTAEFMIIALPKTNMDRRIVQHSRPIITTTIGWLVGSKWQHLGSIAVSIFLIILVDFDKFWDEQASLTTIERFP